MNWQRRTFLKALLTWGVSEWGLSLAGGRQRGALWLDKYAQSLAAPTPRKLALLVGIDDYPSPATLQGCGTDVELQRELLVHRFGFAPSDILVLAGEQATREGIATAFLEHLTAQAQAGDVAVFHFSGCGSQVKLPRQGEEVAFRLANSFLPRGGTAPRNDLLEETLLLLARTLPTEKLTLVLDASHLPTPQRLQGNWRVRSFPNQAESASPPELALQEQLKSRLKSGKIAGKQPGTILRAAAPHQTAVEIAGSGFSAGLFTYFLTQYLWEVTPANRIAVALSRTAQQMASLRGKQQQCQWEARKKPFLFPYGLMPEAAASAQGIIAAVEEGGKAEIHLKGLPLAVVEEYGLNSCFSLVLAADGSSQPPPAPLLQIHSRQGLVAQGQLLKASAWQPPPLQVGQLVQEAIRILPRQIGLAVALAPQLERIERVDATSALASSPAVSAVVGAGEQGADCVLGKVEKTAAAAESIYGLFSAGGILFPQTAGTASEAIKSAVGRLSPYLQELLAAKLWRLADNESSSRLPVRVTLELVASTSQPLIWRSTGQGKQGQREVPLAKGLLSLERGSRLQYRLENESEQSLYFLLVGLEASGKAVALYSPPPAGESDSSENPSPAAFPAIPPGGSLTLPWRESSPSGWVQRQLFFAPSPLTRAMAALKEELKASQPPLLTLNQPLALAESLLADLHAASAVPASLLGSATDVYGLDVRNWASLSFVYQVVD